MRTYGPLSAWRRVYTPTSWTPARLSGLWLWLRADVVVKDGANRVSAWTDMSGLNNTPVQAVGVDQPLWVASALGGQPTVRFARANTEFLALAALNALHAQPLTWYFVVTPTASATTRVVFDTVNAAPRMFHLLTGGGLAQMNAGAALTGTENINTVGSALCLMFNGVTSDLFVNDFTTAEASGNAGANGIDSVKFGQNQGGVNHLDGDLSEVVAVDGGGSLAQRTLVRDYFNARYGLTVP